MRARSALFTLFGDVVRPTGGEAWLGALTRAMGTLGFTPEATRTALHRMGAEGWVEPRRVGRHSAYRLTDRGVDRLEEAAARIYRLRAAEWDGRWRLLMTGAPSVELARALRWAGFGRLAGELWASPHDHGGRLDALLAAHGLSDAAVPFVATVGTDGSTAAPGPGDRRIVATAWDLGALRDAHAAFLARWADTPEPADPRDAFRTRALLVHDWRGFLFLDPGLPAALLPADWLGDEAAARFRAVYEAVTDAAWAWWGEASATAVPGVPLPHPPPASPFQRGLAALSTRRPA